MNVSIMSTDNGCCSYVFHVIALVLKFLKHSYAMFN
jgi:hypothetical protein